MCVCTRLTSSEFLSGLSHFSFSAYGNKHHPSKNQKLSALLTHPDLLCKDVKPSSYNQTLLFFSFNDLTKKALGLQLLHNIINHSFSGLVLSLCQLKEEPCTGQRLLQFSALPLGPNTPKPKQCAGYSACKSHIHTAPL